MPLSLLRALSRALSPAICVVLLLAGCAAVATERNRTPREEGDRQDQGRLTIDRLFGSEFQAERFGPSWWLEDSGLATLEAAAQGGQDLVRFDPADRKSVV